MPLIWDDDDKSDSVEADYRRFGRFIRNLIITVFALFALFVVGIAIGVWECMT